MTRPEPIPTEPQPGRFAYRFEGDDHGSSISFFVSNPEPGWARFA